MPVSQTLRRLVLAIACVAASAGCARLEDSHGYVPEPSALNDIVVGREIELDVDETAAPVMSRTQALLQLRARVGRPLKGHEAAALDELEKIDRDAVDRLAEKILDAEQISEGHDEGA